NRRYRKIELAGELEVALIAARHSHDCAGAVSHQYVVGNEHRYWLARGGIGRERADEHAGLVTGVGLPLHVGLGLRLSTIRVDRGRRRLVTSGPSVGRSIRPLGTGQRVDERVFG